MSEAPPAIPTPTPTPNTISSTGFYADEDFDFITRMAVGYASQGVFDIGEVLSTIARIDNGDADGWYAAWRATAEKLHQRATAALVAGYTETARRLFLGASESYSQAIAFSDAMNDTSSFAPTFALHRQCWEAFIDAHGGKAERIAVPYDHTTLPGYLFRPDTSGTPRPTLVLTNGSDGSISGLWAYGVGTALSRGWNAFVYDGPGQQSVLYDQGLTFRPDWEAVLTPVVDSLVTRDDVIATELFAYGVSQAGYWVPRALAFEKRFRAAVADPGVVDVSTKWMEQIPPQLVSILQSGNKDVFNGAIAEAAADPKLAQAMAFRGRPFGQPTAYDTFTAVMGYNLHAILDKIDTPLLITDPDEETFWPGQAEQLAAALTGEHQLVKFSREDGANFHCEPMGRAEAECRMFDFFAEHLKTAH